MISRTPRRLRPALALLALCIPAALVAAAPRPAPPRANVLLITVDTLRADRLSGYGYDRPTTPNIDRLLARSVRFTEARAVEPLTNPSLASMLTSRYPHEHGATRNGIRMRQGLESLPKLLRARGWRTAAIVGNWTLKDRLSGMAEHFEEYDGVFTRKRWFGVLKSEATAADLTDQAIAWLRARSASPDRRPFFLWVHYVEPHAPYRFQESVARGIGITAARRPGPLARYDTEVAFVDRQIGRLLDAVEPGSVVSRTLVVFTADHGESLGEHGYWGHGRNLYDETLHIPMAVSWPGTVPAMSIEAPAQNVDIAPTVLSLLGQPLPPAFRGFDWAPVIHGRRSPPVDRVTRYQAHRGAVLTGKGAELARRSGLLEIGVLRGDRKEVFRIESGQRSLFDLDSGPREGRSLVAPRSEPSKDLMTWMRTVYSGLTAFDQQPVEPLDPESAEQLRSLGYVD